jgi:hypothetical protein
VIEATSAHYKSKTIDVTEGILIGLADPRQMCKALLSYTITHNLKGWETSPTNLQLAASYLDIVFAVASRLPGRIPGRRGCP